MEILLYNPEIPPNTGNIARLCAATEIPLHLVKPLGFSLEDRYLKRAGLDYWEHVNLSVWDNMADFLEKTGQHKRLVLTSARRGTVLQDFQFTKDDVLVFGAETTGLPKHLYELSDNCINIPTKNVRSINLSTSAGIILYQGLIQTGLIANYL